MGGQQAPLSSGLWAEPRAQESWAKKPLGIACGLEAWPLSWGFLEALQRLRKCGLEFYIYLAPIRILFILFYFPLS